MNKKIKYKRVLLKLTGELFGGSNKKGLDFASIKKVAKYLCDLQKKTGVQLAIVSGAGNLFRGREITGTGFDRATADYIGMLGTIMNCLALQGEMEMLGVETRVMSAIPVNAVCEPYFRRKALHHLNLNRVVILAGGTGSPFFTTDSAAALKACELNCDILLKGSNVDGVYTSDPKKDTTAKMYKKISHEEALHDGIAVMDNTAFALCHNEKVPIVVFNLNEIGNIEKIICGEEIGTLIN